MEKEALEIMKKIDFFQDFSPDERLMLLDVGEWVKAYSGDYIIREGNKNLKLDYMFVLMKGSAKVVKQNKVLMTLEAGTSFGEIGALTGAPRSAHVIAQEECYLLRFHSNHIDRLPVEFQLKLLKKLLYTMASRLLDLDNRLLNVLVKKPD